MTFKELLVSVNFENVAQHIVRKFKTENLTINKGI